MCSFRLSCWGQGSPSSSGRSCAQGTNQGQYYVSYDGNGIYHCIAPNAWHVKASWYPLSCGASSNASVMRPRCCMRHAAAAAEAAEARPDQRWQDSRHTQPKGASPPRGASALFVPVSSSAHQHPPMVEGIKAQLRGAAAGWCVRALPQPPSTPSTLPPPHAPPCPAPMAALLPAVRGAAGGVSPRLLRWAAAAGQCRSSSLYASRRP